MKDAKSVIGDWFPVACAARTRGGRTASPTLPGNRQPATGNVKSVTGETAPVPGAFGARGTRAANPQRPLNGLRFTFPAPAATFAARDTHAASPHRPLNGSRFTLYAVALTLLALAPNALACSVCYGAPGDPLVKGANNGIMLLLGIVGFVQIGFIAMFWSFWRKAREQKRFRESLRVIEGGPRS